jgi:hydrogenase maturation protease
MRLVVFGWGNLSRGDDGIGPLLLARIEQTGWTGATLIEDFQLQLEHALDLRGAEMALFLDAGRDTPAPFSFSEIFPCANLAHTSHALAPEAVLAVYRQTQDASPPPSFLLCVPGEDFALGAGLSARGAERLDAAWAFLERLDAARDPTLWRALAAGERGRLETI